MNFRDKMKAKAAAGAKTMKDLLAKAEAENRELTAEESAEFDIAEKSISDAKAAIARLDRADAADTEARGLAATAEPEVPAVIRDVTGTAPRVPAAPVEKLTGQQIVGICAWGAARHKHMPRHTPLEHVEKAGFQQIADASRATDAALKQAIISSMGATGAMATKALTTLVASELGNGITTPLSTDFIETLRNESAFLSGGPVELDMSFGSIDIPAGLAGATGTYGAEGADLPYTQMTTRKVSLAAKHLKAVTAINNNAIAVSPLAVASIVGDDLQMGLTLAMDAAGLRGDGAGSNPAGLLTLVNAAHKFVATANVVAPTIAQIDADARNALSKFRSSNVPRRRPRWIMCNRTFTYLQFLRDGNGNFAYPGLHLPVPTWHGNLPVTLSEQVPSNLGAGTNESEIYLQDFGHVLMGISRSLTLTASTEASYKNSGGTLVSAFSLDETVVRGLASHDFDMRHDKSGVIITAVKWGG